MIVIIPLGLIALVACLMWLGRERPVGVGMSRSVTKVEPLQEGDAMQHLLPYTRENND